ncbi:type IX secretion/gliding motility protein PorT/SprT [Nitritalea halalkaliphila]
MRYSDAFLSAPDPASTVPLPVQESRTRLHSVVPLQTLGFSLGFLGILRLDDQVNLLFTPAVGFYEHELMRYTFSTDPVDGATKLPLTQTPVSFDATLVELPLLLKYKSQRFNNTRMYFIGGLNYMFRTKSQDEANLEDLVLTGQDLSLELGMGFDIYFRFFKWSPEIRFSHGLLDVYKAGADLNDTNYGDALQSVRRRNIRLIFNFQ